MSVPVSCHVNHWPRVPDMVSLKHIGYLLMSINQVFKFHDGTGPSPLKQMVSVALSDAEGCVAYKSRGKAL